MSYDEFFVYICFLTLMPRPFYYQCIIYNIYIIVLLSACHISPFTPISKVQILLFKSIIESSLTDKQILSGLDQVSGKDSSFITFEQFLALDQIISSLFIPLESIRNQYRNAVFTLKQYYNIMYRNNNITEIRNYYEIHHSYPSLPCFKYIQSLFSEFGNPYKYDYILTTNEMSCNNNNNNNKSSSYLSSCKNNNNDSCSYCKRVTRSDKNSDTNFTAIGTMNSSCSGFIFDDYCNNNTGNNGYYGCCNNNMNTSRIENLVKSYCRIANPPYCKLRIDEGNNIKPISVVHNRRSSSSSTKIIKPSNDDVITTSTANSTYLVNVKSVRTTPNINEKEKSSKSGKESNRSSIVTITQTRCRCGTDGALELELQPLEV